MGSSWLFESVPIMYSCRVRVAFGATRCAPRAANVEDWFVGWVGIFTLDGRKCFVVLAEWASGDCG